MNILILFATVEGQTRKIARFIANEVEKLGHSWVIRDVDGPEPISFQGVDRVILAASVHQRRHPKSFEATVAALSQDLAGFKTLLLSVSLNAAFPEGREEAQEYVTEMKMRTGLSPDTEMLVAGAVRVDEYDYFAKQVVQHVVMRGRPFDPNAGEHEFTEWDAVSAKVAEFVNH